MYALEMKHVVVTGGTGALGSGVVGAFLDAGAICHVPVFNASELQGYPHAGHSRLRFAENVDLTDEASVVAFYTALQGDLFASVHLAGGFAMSPLGSTSAADLAKMLDMNVRTSFLCCREAARRITTAGNGGRIVNVAAKAGIEPTGTSGMAAYVAAKAAVAALTQALGNELKDARILVNAVAPSIIDTPGNRAAMPNADLSLWPKVDEIAATIVFLASPANEVTRSAVVPVYGRS
jgi:NAD(P)-dependent dehydrogenase (short-subunit alcohol dehydrogenase family)